MKVPCKMVNGGEISIVTSHAIGLLCQCQLWEEIHTLYVSFPDNNQAVDNSDEYNKDDDEDSYDGLAQVSIFIDFDERTLAPGTYILVYFVGYCSI